MSPLQSLRPKFLGMTRIEWVVLVAIIALLTFVGTVAVSTHDASKRVRNQKGVCIAAGYPETKWDHNGKAYCLKNGPHGETIMIPIEKVQ